MKKVVAIAALAALLAAGVLSWMAWERYRQFLLTPLDLPAQGEIFLLPSGATGSDIVEQLSQMNFTRPGHSIVLKAFDDKTSAGYMDALALIRAGGETLKSRPRADMPGFQPAEFERKCIARNKAHEAAQRRVSAAILAGKKVFDE